MLARVLVTGGAGYIGAHVVLALARAGYAPLILDNLANSSASVQPRLARLAGADIPLHVADVRDRRALGQLFAAQPIDAVVHCAGLKAVADGEAQPLAYYDNNVGGSIALLCAMKEAGVRTLVFSSSASVYGQPESNPVPENAAVRPANVYGRTKREIELILSEAGRRADGSWRIALLRYFNPAGADASGQIGEAPSGSPNNLVPILAEVALGRRPCLQIFGEDYPTPDGTGVRDYIHVSDLADGHVAALRYLGKAAGTVTLNLGLGHGSSVREVLGAFERACGRRIPWKVVPRRPGDVACYYADPARANALLGWRARRDLDEICGDAWRWASRPTELQGTRRLTSRGL